MCERGSARGWALLLRWPPSENACGVCQRAVPAFLACVVVQRDDQCQKTPKKLTVSVCVIVVCFRFFGTFFAWVGFARKLTRDAILGIMRFRRTAAWASLYSARKVKRYGFGVGLLHDCKGHEKASLFLWSDLGERVCERVGLIIMGRAASSDGCEGGPWSRVGKPYR